jgi:putative SOS response-associated peptidase YedK
VARRGGEPFPTPGAPRAQNREGRSAAPPGPSGSTWALSVRQHVTSVGMCGRYTTTASRQAIADYFGVPVPRDEGTQRYNVAPSEQVLVIASPRGEREAELMRWGLVPPWSKDLKSSYKMINARLETAATSPAYRALLPKASRRALQVADGYYEWLKPERRGEPRQPVFFQVDDGAPFAFAALWTPAKIDDEWIHSVALLTCDSSSNKIAAAIHDRMPVILPDAEARDAWLDPSVDADDALALCQPLPSSRLSARPVSRAVNKAGDQDGPELLLPPEPDRD